MYGSRLGASHRLIAPRFGPRRHSPPEHKLSELAPPETAGAAHDAALATHVDIIGAYETRAKGNGDLDQSNGIDKSALAIATPRRYRNREHLRYVAQQTCLICGRKQSVPHHLRYLQPRALGRKVSDEFAVPLCRSHHRAVHRAGDEQAWWTAAGIDPSKSPASSGGKPGSMIRILKRRVSRCAWRPDRVERREASVPRHGTRRASLARTSRVSQTRQQDKCACRRSAHPSLGWTRKEKREPGRNNALGDAYALRIADM